jgi:glucokinase
MKACVDVGGTKLAVGLVSDAFLQDGVRPAPLLARRSELTAKTGAPEAVARQILRMLADACEEAGLDDQQLEAVGVSSCGPFVLKAGLIELAAPNICGGLAGPARGLPNQWTSAVLEAPLLEKFGTRLRVENDGVGALQAERRWGALQGIDNCAYVTWSTGIGWGLCVDGRVLRGKHGNAGHAGHMFVSDGPDYRDALCGCGNLGDLEGLVAGNAIARRFAGTGYLDAAALLAAARIGDAVAVAIVDELCRVMGRALYNVVVTLDLQRISLGGSVFWHHRAYLLPRLQAQLSGKLPALTGGCTLVAAGLQDSVGDYAALALVA